MNRRKSMARLARRRKAFNTVKCNMDSYHGLLCERPGFKHPGSNKKPWPEGRSARQARRREAEARMAS